jgi:hypothetical protein
MAIQAIHALAGVQAYLVFVNHGVLHSRVAFGAFPRSAHEFRTGLIGFRFGPGAVEQKGGYNQGEGNDKRDKYGAKRHGLLPSEWASSQFFGWLDMNLDTLGGQKEVVSRGVAVPI